MSQKYLIRIPITVLYHWRCPPEHHGHCTAHPPKLKGLNEFTFFLQQKQGLTAPGDGLVPPLT